MYPVMNAPQSTGAFWWGHHIRATRAYAEGMIAGDFEKALQAGVQLWEMAIQWGFITRSDIAGLLIGEHTMLAKLLVDGLAGGKDGWPDVAVAALVANVQAQGKLFPRDPAGFVALFGPHVEITGAYITALAKGDMSTFNSKFQEALENGGQLAAFTYRTFGLIR
jgi:hypothetical protein